MSLCNTGGSSDNGTTATAHFSLKKSLISCSAENNGVILFHFVLAEMSTVKKVFI